MTKKEIEQLFTHYIHAFQLRNIESIKMCYQLPCTLHTPDKIVLIENDIDFEGEFLDIFAVLNHAQITRFMPLKASFSVLSEQLVLACVDWQFIGENEQVFTDFTACYHIALNSEDWKIFNVVSQDLSQSLTLETAFNISDKTNEVGNLHEN